MKKILVVVDVNIAHKTTVTEGGAQHEQMATKDAALVEVTRLMNNGYELISTGGGVYTLQGFENEPKQWMTLEKGT